MKLASHNSNEAFRGIVFSYLEEGNINE